MIPHIFKCPSCGRTITASEEHVGRQIRCLNCQHCFFVPPRITDYYRILGVTYDADMVSIRTAYLKEAMIRHPDRGGSHSLFLELSEAYGILSDPQLRQDYDYARMHPRDTCAQKKAAAERTQAREQAQSYPQKWENFENWSKDLFATMEMAMDVVQTNVMSGLARLGELRGSLESIIHPYRKHLLRLIPDPILPHPDPDEGESLDITGYTQLDGYSCGAIAGWTVLSAIYPESSWRDFYAECSPSPDDGVSDSHLVKLLRAYGVGVSTKKDGLTFAAIKKAINEGFPILTILDRPGRPYAHWVVIYGYSETKKPKSQLVYVAGNNFIGLHTETLGGPNPLPYREFAKLSKHFNSYVCWGKE